MPHEEENTPHGQSAARKLHLAVHTSECEEYGLVCLDGAAICPYLGFLGSCVVLVAFVAHSRRINNNFAACVCLDFVHRTSSNHVILALVIDTFGTAAACLVGEI